MYRALALLGLCGALIPQIAFAHAFGQQYTLPLPTNLYIIGGGGVLVLSFVLLFFLPAHTLPKTEKKIMSERMTTYVLQMLQVATAILFLCAVLIGLWGSQQPDQNITPYFFWIVVLLGFAYFSIFVQGVWKRITPFEYDVPFLPHISPTQKLPKVLHHVPALVLYVVLLWSELLTQGASAVPQTVALGLIGYVLYAWFIIDRYGKTAWQEHFDMFGVFFRLLGFFSFIEVRNDGTYIRPPLKVPDGQQQASIGLTLFILCILAFTAFDGFRETAVYVQTFVALFSVIPYTLFELVVFLLFPSVFLIIFATCIYTVRRIGNTQESLLELITRYAYSLIPIAVVYHLAHYFTLLLVEGQRIIGLISDPLHIGWNLFGTKDYVINPGIIGADMVWYIQLTLIVVGHMIALYISHSITRSRISSRMRVLYAELPLLAVMVFFTAFGLWILSQPFAL